MSFEANAIKGFHLALDDEGKEIVKTSKLYIWYLNKSFREGMEKPIAPGDVVLVKGKFKKGSKKRANSRVLVMETFYYDGEVRHAPVIAVLERYNSKEKEQK